MTLTYVEDGVREAADRLQRAFGLPRAVAVVERWATTDDRRWGQVAALLRERAGREAVT